MSLRALKGGCRSHHRQTWIHSLITYSHSTLTYNGAKLVRLETFA